MKRLLETQGVLMGVDFGDKRTGLAVSNRSRSIASGIGQISVGGMQKTAEAVANIARERGVSGIVVGLPINMDGSRGPRAQKVSDFAARLEAACGISVILVDERCSTMVAHRFLNETNCRGKKRKQVVDTLSAEIILQDYLDKKNRGAFNG